jgi:hypothetical protein
MTYKSMAYEAPRQTTFENGWPFSADIGPEIKNIYVTKIILFTYYCFVCENSNITKRHKEKIEIRSNLHY